MMKKNSFKKMILFIFCLSTIFSIASLQSAYGLIIPQGIISMPQTSSGTPGQTDLSIPINVTNATGIARVDITLTFSSSILTATNFQLTPLTSGFILQTPWMASGQVTISITQASGIPSGSGAILNVIFDVFSSAPVGAYDSLTLQSVSIFDSNNQPLSYAKINGLFTVIPADNPDISNLPPSPPINLSPLENETVFSLTPTLQASPFFDVNSEDTHASSQWQVDDQSDFGSPVFNSNETTTEKTSMTLPLGLLTSSTTYYWMVRYKDSQGGWSPWSSFTSFIPQIPPEKWSGEVSFNLKFSVYVEDNSGNEKIGSETAPFTGVLEIYWADQERNIVPNENGCLISFTGSSDYGPSSFCITQKASLLTSYINPTTTDTSYLKGIGTFRGKYHDEELEGVIFIDVTKATFKKDKKTGALVSIGFSSKLGGGTDDVTVFSGTLNGTLIKE